MKKITQQIHQHLDNFSLFYVILVVLGLIFTLSYFSYQQSISEHGKIEKIQGCEFVKLYIGGNHTKFQYIHNPKCPNCVK